MSLRDLIWEISVLGASEAAKDIASFDKSVDGAKDNMGSFDKKLTDISKSIKDIGKDINKAGKEWTKAMAPFLVAGTAGFKMSLDLDTANRQVSTLANDLSLEDIGVKVRLISDNTGFSQKEIANAAYDALSSGVSENDLWEFVESNIDLTRAGFTDMSTAIDATTTVLNAYGDAANDVTKIHDIFVKTQDLGKITVDELGQNIGRVIPTAAAASVSLEQIGAAYSMLTAKGQNSNIATTNLNSMLSELSKTGSGVDEALRKETGKSFIELSKEGVTLGDTLEILNKNALENGLTLKDMFGNISAGNAALSLFTDSAEEYNSILEEMKNSDGATADNAEKMAGPALELQKATNSIKNALIDVGGVASSFVIPIAEAVSDVVKKFSELDSATQSSIVQWGAIAIAAGPVISVFGTIVGAVGTGISVFGSFIGAVSPIVSLFGSTIPAVLGAVLSPFGLLVGVIGTLIGIGVNLYNNWETVKARAEELGGGIKGYLMAALEETGNMFGRLKDKAVEALDKIKSKWNEVKEFLKNPIKGVISIFSSDSSSSATVSSGVSSASGAGGLSSKVGSYATGLNYVPRDNFLANLHGGEMILTKKTSDAYRALGGTKDSVPVNNITSGVNNVNSGGNSPTINITVQGNADKDTINDIASAVDERLAIFFRKMELQRV